MLTRLEINEWCWGFLVVVFGLHMYTSRHSDALRFFLHPATFLAYGWMIFGMDLLLYTLVRRAHLRVLRTLRQERAAATKDEASTDLQAPTLSSSSYSSSSVPRPASVVAELKTRRRDLLISLQEEEEEEGGKKGQKGRSSLDIGASTSSSHPHPHHHKGGILRGGHHATDVVVEGAEACSFTPWERRTFEWGTQVLSILRCLYMAAYLCAFIFPSFKRFGTGTAVLIVLSIPIPAILTAAFLIPAMVCKYLLVKSAGVITIEALDAVVLKMDLIEESFVELSLAVQRLAATEKDEKEKEKGEEEEEEGGLTALLAALDRESKKGFIHHAKLHDLLHTYGVALSERHFQALARFLDLRQDKTVHVSDLKALLQAKEVFHTKGPQAFQRRQSVRLVAEASGMGEDEEEEEGGQIELKIVG